MATVNGYDAEEHEVAALLDVAIDDEDRADPMRLYVRASSMQALYLTAAERLGQLRAEAIRRMVDDTQTGDRYQTIGDLVGLTKARVQQMIASARNTMRSSFTKT